MAALTRARTCFFSHRPSPHGTSLLQVQTYLRVASPLLVHNPAFSTSVRSPNKSTPPKSNEEPTRTTNSELPKISLEGLGITKNMQIVLYTLLGIWGTFEMYFYYQALMRWWRSRSAIEPESVD
ncbi:hypothetical protein BDV12DRAFT_20697 [Aspergillus spectabilis]